MSQNIKLKCLFTFVWSKSELQVFQYFFYKSKSSHSPLNDPRLQYYSLDIDKTFSKLVGKSWFVQGFTHASEKVLEHLFKVNYFPKMGKSFTNSKCNCVGFQNQDTTLNIDARPGKKFFNINKMERDSHKAEYKAEGLAILLARQLKEPRTFPEL